MQRIVRLLTDHRWPRFLVVGGLCFATNIAILYIGTERLGQHYLVSMAVSVLAANSLGWALNRWFTFGASDRSAGHEYLRYMAVNASAFLVSMSLMAILVSGLGVNYLVASAGLAATLTVVNFVLHRDWSFRRTHGQGDVRR